MQLPEGGSPSSQPWTAWSEGVSFETPLYFTLETVQRISVGSNAFQDPRCAPAGLCRMDGGPRAVGGGRLLS